MKRTTGLIMAVLCAVAACERGIETTAPVVQFGKAASAEPDTSVVAQIVNDSEFKGAMVEGAVIGPEGGTVIVGEMEIIVPPGAVDRSTRFSIRLPPQSRTMYAWAVFEPHAKTFAVPVTLRLPYSSTNALPGAAILWWDEDVSEGVPLPSTITPDGRIETQVSHFSIYATSRFGITMAGG
jgi:hypothetical protein